MIHQDIQAYLPSQGMDKEGDKLVWDRVLVQNIQNLPETGK